jgi:hypothetical protein
MEPKIELAPGAEENGLASMLGDLLRQNLQQKPQKLADFGALVAQVAIIAADAQVTLTLRFDRGRLVIHDGIVGVPDVTIRGDSEAVLALSNLPLAAGLPLALPGSGEGWAVLRMLGGRVWAGKLKIRGALGHWRQLLKLARVMSVNG